jgi:hypothetical protein
VMSYREKSVPHPAAKLGYQILFMIPGTCRLKCTPRLVGSSRPRECHFLEWEMFQTKVVEKIKKTVFMFSSFFKSCCLWHIVKKYGTARQATDDNIMRHTRFAC